MAFALSGVSKSSRNGREGDKGAEHKQTQDRIVTFVGLRHFCLHGLLSSIQTCGLTMNMLMLYIKIFPSTETSLLFSSDLKKKKLKHLHESLKVWGGRSSMPAVPNG